MGSVGNQRLVFIKVSLLFSPLIANKTTKRLPPTGPSVIQEVRLEVETSLNCVNILFWPLVLLAALLQNSYALSLHNQMLLLALRTAFFQKRRFPVISDLSWQHNLTVSFKGWASFSVFSRELPLSHC